MADAPQRTLPVIPSAAVPTGSLLPPWLSAGLVVTLLTMVFTGGVAWGRQETQVRISLLEQRFTAHEQASAPHPGVAVKDTLIPRLEAIETQLRDLKLQLQDIQKRQRQ